jgi:DNA-binding transcriptional MerR regulator
VSDAATGSDRGEFRAPEACRIVSITYRQFDHRARTELVTPSLRPGRGSRTPRLYSFTDLVELRVITQLLDSGIRIPPVGR